MAMSPTEYDYFSSDPVQELQSDAGYQELLNTPVSPVAAALASSALPLDQQVVRYLSNPTEMTDRQRGESNFRLAQLTGSIPLDAPMPDFSPRPAGLGVRQRTYEEVQQEAQTLGALTLGDTVRDIAKPGRYVPFARTFLEDPEAMDLGWRSARAQGWIPGADPMSPEEQQQLLVDLEERKFQDAVKAERRQKHTSWLSSLGHLALEGAAGMIPYGMEMRVSSALVGGLGRVVAGKVALDAAKVSAEVAAQTAAKMAGASTKLAPGLQGQLVRNAMETVAKGSMATRAALELGEVAAVSAFRGGLTTPAAFLQRAIPEQDDLVVDDKGIITGVQDRGGPAGELGKAFASEAISTAVEFTGKYIDAGVEKYVMPKLSKMFAKAPGAALRKTPEMIKAKKSWTELANRMSKRYQINQIPGEYLEERIDMLAQAIFNTDKKNENKPLSSRLADVLRYEVDNPVEAAAMALSFAVFPGAQRAYGLARGWAAPYDAQQNRELAERADQKFFAPEQRKALLHEILDTTVNDTTETWWSRLWNFSVKAATGKESKHKGPLPLGSFGHYAQQIFGPQDHREFKAGLVDLLKKGKTDQALSRVANVWDAFSSHVLLNADVAPGEKETSPYELLGRVPSAGLTETAKALNVMVQEGKITFAEPEISHQVLARRQWGKDTSIPRAMIGREAFEKLDKVAKAVLTKYATVVEQGAEAKAEPFITIPAADINDKVKGRDIQNMLMRLNPGQGAAVFDRIQRAVKADPTLETINLAPSTMMAEGSSRRVVSGLNVSDKEVAYTTETDVPSTVEEAFHAATRKQASRIPGAFSAFEKHIKDQEGNATPEYQAAKAALETIKGNPAQMNEVFTKMSVVAAGLGTGTWTNWKDAQRAIALHGHLMQSPEGRKLLRYYLSTVVGQGVFDAQAKGTADATLNPFLVTEEGDEAPPAAPVFTPSDKWQVVPPGVALPPGWQMRVNPETGLTEHRWEKVTPAPADAKVPTGSGSDPMDLAAAAAQPAAARLTGTPPPPAEDRPLPQGDEGVQDLSAVAGESSASETGKKFRARFPALNRLGVQLHDTSFVERLEDHQKDAKSQEDFERYEESLWATWANRFPSSYAELVHSNTPGYREDAQRLAKILEEKYRVPVPASKFPAGLARERGAYVGVRLSSETPSVFQAADSVSSVNVAERTRINQTSSINTLEAMLRSKEKKITQEQVEGSLSLDNRLLSAMQQEAQWIRDRIASLRADAATVGEAPQQLAISDNLTDESSPQEIGFSYSSDESQSATRVVRDIMKKAGIPGQQLQLPAMRGFVEHPKIAAALKSDAEFKRVFSEKTPFDAADMENTLFNAFTRSANPMTRADLIQIAIAGKQIISWPMMIDEQWADGSWHSVAPLDKAAFADMERVTSHTAKLVKDQIVGKPPAPGVRDKRPSWLLSRFNDYGARLAVKNPEKTAGVLQTLTGIPKKRWMRLGDRRLETFRRLLVTELGGADSKTEAKGLVPGVIRPFVTAYTATGSRLGAADVSMFLDEVASRLANVFNGQLELVQERAAKAIDSGRRSERLAKAERTTYSIIQQLAYHAPAALPMRVMDATGKYRPTTSFRSHLYSILESWEGHDFYASAGIRSVRGDEPPAQKATTEAELEKQRRRERAGHIAFDSRSASEMQQSHITEVSRAKFDRQLADPDAKTYDQNLPQLGDKTQRPQVFVSMPLYRADTAQGLADIHQRLKAYEKRYDEVVKAMGKENADTIMVQPAALWEAFKARGQMTADQLYSINYAFNNLSILRRLAGDVGKYKSASNLIKRLGSIATPGAEPVLGLEDGVKDKTRILLVKDPTRTIRYPTERLEDPSKSVASTDGTIIAMADWARRYGVSVGGLPARGDPNGFHFTKVLHSDVADGQWSLIKCAAYHEDLATADDPGSSGSKALVEAIKDAGINVDMVVFTEAAKMTGAANALDVLKFDDKTKTWSVTRPLTEQDVGETDSTKWRWVLDATDDVEKHQDTVKRQFYLSLLSLNGGKRIVDSYLSAQADALKGLRGMTRDDLLKEVIDEVVDRIPSLRSYKDGKRKSLTSWELQGIQDAMSRKIANMSELEHPAMSHTVNVSAGGSEALTTTEFREWTNDGNVKGKRNHRSSEVRLTRGIINISKAKGNDEATVGIIAKGPDDRYTRTPGKLLGAALTAKEADDPLFRDTNLAESLYRFGWWMVKHGELRPDLMQAGMDFDGMRAALEGLSIPVTWTEGKRESTSLVLKPAIKPRGVVNALRPFVRMSEVQDEKVGNLFELHVPGEPTFVQRVPTGGADAIILVRMTTFIPSAGNISILPDEDWSKTGADFDIDSWYNQHVLWDDKGMGLATKGNAALFNDSMLRFIDLFSDPGNIDKLYVPVDTARYKDILAPERKMAPVNSPDNTATALQKVGKSLLGFQAVLDRIWDVSMRNGVYGKTIDIGTDEEPRLVGPKYDLEGFSLDFSQERMQRLFNDKDALFTLQEDLSTILNMAADHGKLNGIVTRLGITDLNANVAMMLLWGSPQAEQPEGREVIRTKIRDFLLSPRMQDYDQRERERRAELLFFRRKRKIKKQRALSDLHEILLTLSDDFRTVQQAINVVYYPPTTMLEFVNARESLNAVLKNQLPTFDTADLAQSPEIRASGQVLDTLTKLVFNKELPLNSEALLETIQERVKFLPGRPRQARIKQEETNYIRRLYSAAVPQSTGRDLGQVIRSLKQWKRERPGDAVLDALSLGRNYRTGEVEIVVNGMYKMMEPDDARWADIHRAWDKLPAHVKDDLAWYTLYSKGPSRSMWNNAFDMLFSPAYAELLDSYVTKPANQERAIGAIEAPPAAAPVAKAEAPAPATSVSDTLEAAPAAAPEVKAPEALMAGDPEELDPEVKAIADKKRTGEVTNDLQTSMSDAMTLSEDLIQKIPGMSSAAHRLFKALSNRRRGNEALANRLGNDLLRLVGGSTIAHPWSKTNAKAADVLAALTVILDRADRENLDSLTLEQIAADPGMFTYTKVKPLLDADGNQQYEIDPGGDVGLPLFEAVDPKRVADILREFEKPKGKDAWRKALLQAAKDYDILHDAASPVLELPRRKRYAFHQYDEFQPGMTAIDIESLNKAYRQFYLTNPSAALGLKIDKATAAALVEAAKNPDKATGKMKYFLDKYEPARAAFVKRSMERFRRQQDSFAGMKDSEEWDRFVLSSDVVQTQARKMDTYADAAKYGYTPVTLNASQLIPLWQQKLGAAEQNKLYLNAVAVGTDGSGRPSVVLSQDADGQEKVKMFDKSIAFEHLRNLLSYLQKLPTLNKTLADFKINNLANPWEQMRALLDKVSFENNAEKWGWTHVELPTGRLGVTKAWAQPGVSQQLLHHLASRGTADLIKETRGVKKVLWHALRLANRFNGFVKQMRLTMSGFHYFALLESYVGGLGIGLARFNLGAAWRGFKKARADLLTGDAAVWSKAGLDLSYPELMNRDFGAEATLTALEKWSDKRKFTSVAKPVLQAVNYGFKLQNHFLWNVVAPAMKIQLADTLWSEARSDFPNVPEANLRRDVALVVNDLLGGQDWSEYLWATPKAREIMKGLMLAPDWTISAINAASLGELTGKLLQLDTPLSKQWSTPFTSQLLADRYWPTFFLMIILAMPNIVQAMMYAMNLALPEELQVKDMKPITFLNETDREFHMDVTPLYNMFGKRYGSTRRRRVYWRFGKQFFELSRWFTDSWNAYLVKSSPTVQVAIEQLFNRNAAGWDMPWADQELPANERTAARVKAIASMFAPMSVMPIFADRPTSFFAPATLGVSKTAARDQMEGIFTAYAEDTIFSKIAGVPSRVKKMKDLVPDVVDAMLRNGFTKDEIKETISSSLAGARRRYNYEISLELQRNSETPADINTKELARAIAKTRRIDGAWRNLNDSIDRAMRATYTTTTPEQRAQIRDAVREAWILSLENREAPVK